MNNNSTNLSNKQALKPLQLLKEGWAISVSNFKVFVPAVILAFALVYGCHLQLISFLTERSPNAQPIELVLQSSAIIGLLFSPVEVAIMMLGVKVARKEPIKLINLLDHLAKSPMIILVAIIITGVVQLGMFLVLPGIFFIVALSMAQLLLCDKNYSMIKALSESLRVVTKNWFACFSVYLMLIGFILLSFMTMGIALIVTIPLYVSVKGLMYRQLFLSDDALAGGDHTEFEA